MLILSDKTAYIRVVFSITWKEQANFLNRAACLM